MPTDPFVAELTADAPRQEPNLSPGVRLPAARNWRADRPGDLRDGIQPRGPRFGDPGPNIGYALLLVHRMRSPFALTAFETHHDVDPVVAALAMKRAASYGRAPVAADVECAALALGYLGPATPELVAWRADAVDGAGHDYGTVRRICDAVPLEALRLAPDALAARAGQLHAGLSTN